MSVFIISGDINLKRASSTSQYSRKHIFYALSINGQNSQAQKMKWILFT